MDLDPVLMVAPRYPDLPPPFESPQTIVARDRLHWLNILTASLK